jgi:hypothetical protein
MKANIPHNFGHDLIYQSKNNYILLFGGFDEVGHPNSDTWIFKDNSWEKITNIGPTPRKWPALAYDDKYNRILLFGGREGIGREGKSLNDLWEWKGNSWESISYLDEGPSSRDHHRMAYDKSRDSVVLFGGWDGKKVIGDTWEFTKNEWLKFDTNEPNPRAAHALVYNERLEKVILWGGKHFNDFYNDMWTWNGLNWEKISTPDPKPEPRAFHGVTYNNKSGDIILFSGNCGRNDNEKYYDNWNWDGQKWNKVAVKGPGNGSIYSLIYDKHNQFALFHGSGKFDGNQWTINNETWMWKDNKWQKLH